MRKTLILALMLITIFAACDKSKDPKVSPQPEANIIINGVTDISVSQDSTAYMALAINRNGAQEKTDLSITGLPQGTTASFSVAGGTPDFATILSLSAAFNAATGTFPIKITGTTASGKTKSYEAKLTVKDNCLSPAGEYNTTYSDPTGSMPNWPDNTITIVNGTTSGTVTINNLFKTNGINSITASFDCRKRTLVIEPQSMAPDYSFFKVQGTGSYTEQTIEWELKVFDDLGPSQVYQVTMIKK